MKVKRRLDYEPKLNHRLLKSVFWCRMLIPIGEESPQYYSKKNGNFYEKWEYNWTGYYVILWIMFVVSLFGICDVILAIYNLSCIPNT